MVSILWSIMLLAALAGGILLQTAPQVSQAAMAGAAQGIRLGLELAGPLCLWCGVGALLERSGLRDRLSRLLAPLLGRVFPTLRGDRAGFSALSANVTANLLGLGNAATPMGIEACRAMGDGSHRATRAQCRLVVLNTASIQLLPTTVAALRASLGCETPLDILPCVLLSSLCALGAGLGMCRVLERHGF